MTTKQIEKLLELLKENKLEELKTELTSELLRGTDKKSANLFSAIKKYLKHSASINKHRPALATILHHNNKQFIIDGYSAYIFNDYLPELDNLPNTNEETINFDCILLKTPEYETIKSNELTLLKNIKKYISYYKLNFNEDEELKKQEYIYIYWNNNCYDARLLEQTANIMNFDNLQISTYGNNQTQLKSQNITGLVLPLRVTDQNKKEIIKNFTSKFLESLEG